MCANVYVNAPLRMIRSLVFVLIIYTYMIVIIRPMESEGFPPSLPHSFPLFLLPSSLPLTDNLGLEGGTGQAGTAGRGWSGTEWDVMAPGGTKFCCFVLLNLSNTNKRPSCAKFSCPPWHTVFSISISRLRKTPFFPKPTFTISTSYSTVKANTGAQLWILGGKLFLPKYTAGRCQQA